MRLRVRVCMEAEVLGVFPDYSPTLFSEAWSLSELIQLGWLHREPQGTFDPIFLRWDSWYMPPRLAF